MVYIALEYLTYIVVATLLGAFLFGTSTLLLLSQEGARHVALASRRLAERTVHLATTVKSTAAFNPSNPNH